MDRFEEYMTADPIAIAIAGDESSELLETDFQEREEPHKDPVSTDDPVRVYLREMGSVRLLNRQGESTWRAAWSAVSS